MSGDEAGAGESKTMLLPQTSTSEPNEKDKAAASARARERWFYLRKKHCPRLHERKTRGKTLVKDLKLLVHYVLDVYECPEADLKRLEAVASAEIQKNLEKQNLEDEPLVVDANLLAKDFSDALASFDLERAKRSLRRKGVQAVEKKPSELLAEAKKKLAEEGMARDGRQQLKEAATKSTSEMTSIEVVIPAAQTGNSSGQHPINGYSTETPGLAAGDIRTAAASASGDLQNQMQITSAKAQLARQLELKRDSKIYEKSQQAHQLARKALDEGEHLLPLVKEHLQKCSKYTRECGPEVTDFLLKKACKQLDKHGRPELLPNLLQKKGSEILPEELTNVKRQV
ncbi:unnamed protein product [Amoebophrya sp. A120]|nr:unnamed protein product [Amoebophrya sp. A120]|eukprot:GSA120T00012518001.1